MATQFNRRDVGYTIISRFEESLRSFLSEALSILFENYREGIPLGVLEKAKQRSSNEELEDSSDFLENVDFPDLKEIICYKNRYKEYFFEPSLKVEDFQEYMDELYELRCKIAHVRGFFNSFDLDKLAELSREIANFLDDFGQDFHKFLDELKNHPNSVVITVPVEFESECNTDSKVPNNLPVPDYDYEGGFVGRKDDIKKVIKMLEGEKVVTIAGAGGVGKTALASKVVQELIKPTTSKFDGIIWLSAKETKLLYLGIEDVEPTVKNYEQLLETILEVMGFPSLYDETIEEKESNIKTVSNLYESLLIIVDNLETITDESIENFILDVRVEYPNFRILITSRRGLGQVERRYELKQLKKKEAIQLFRSIAKDKNLGDLLKMDDLTIDKVVKKLSYYPLAIKWMIGQVKIGKDIYEITNSINETTSDISKFSFEQIYNSISSDGRKILCALSCFDDPPPAGVLSYAVDIEKNNFEDGIKELTLVSLVIPEQFKNEQDELSRKYILLPLTRGYVRHQLDKEFLLKRDIEDRLRTVQTTLEEAEKAKKQYRFNLSNMGAVTEEEKVAAMIAQNAFQKYQIGRYLEAYEEYKKACDIAPRFASIYRNWAVMESQEGHLVESDQLMRKASQLSSYDPQIWLTWGNLKRNIERTKESIEKYEQAYKLSPEDPIILNALGKAKSRAGEYKEADNLLRIALRKKLEGISVKHDVINLSSLAENLSRWSETCTKNRNFQEAETKLIEALEYCNKIVKLDPIDVKSSDLLLSVYIKLGYLYKHQRDDSKSLTYFEKAILEKPKRYKEIKFAVIGSLQAAKIYLQIGKVTEAKRLCSSEMLRAAERLGGRTKLPEDFRSFYTKLNGQGQSSKPQLIKKKRKGTATESLF